MITVHITDAQQAAAIIELLEQSIELERLKLEISKSTKSDTLDTYLKIMHGESLTSQLIASTASLS